MEQKPRSATDLPLAAFLPQAPCAGGVMRVRSQSEERMSTVFFRKIMLTCQGRVCEDARHETNKGSCGL